MEHPAIKYKQSKDGSWYFVIVAKNNKTLATSEMYKSKQMAEKGATSVCQNITEPHHVCEKPAQTLPPRTNMAIRLKNLADMGINTMADVASALIDGRLKIDGGEK